MRIPRRFGGEIGDGRSKISLEVQLFSLSATCLGGYLALELARGVTFEVALLFGLVKWELVWRETPAGP